MQTIKFFKDPFRLVPVANIAEIADKFTRNEILTSNEIRQIIGMKPSGDPKADQLVNSNIAQPQGEEPYLEEEGYYDEEQPYDEAAYEEPEAPASTDKPLAERKLSELLK